MSHLSSKGQSDPVSYPFIPFGYPNGDSANFPSNQPTTVQFWSGNVINCLIINGIPYGSTRSGTLSPVYNFQSTFQLIELWAGDDNISNMTFVYGGQTVTIGNGSHKEFAFDLSSSMVSWGSVRYGSYVNMLSFYLMS